MYAAFYLCFIVSSACLFGYVFIYVLIMTKRRIFVIFLVISIILAVVIGAIGHTIIGSSMAGGIFGSILTGFIGVWVGYVLLGSWGPLIANFAIVPAITGAILIVFISGLLSRLMRRSAY
jgi:uncharacterized membrane protein YeaQ/YmgE (transglycosylase-associated protein family)